MFTYSSLIWVPRSDRIELRISPRRSPWPSAHALIISRRAAQHVVRTGRCAQRVFGLDARTPSMLSGRAPETPYFRGRSPAK